MDIIGCTVNSSTSLICYNYTTTLGATSNGGVFTVDSYINAVDSVFTVDKTEPIGFFGSDNFTDRYFGTVSFTGCTFNNYTINGDLIYSDASLSYNTYFDTLTDYDPTKAITVGEGCVFNNYGTTFNEDKTGFSASNVSLAPDCKITVGEASVKVESTKETEFTGASIVIGADLSIKYYVFIPRGADIADYTVRFTMNGRTVTVVSDGIATGEGEYVFVFTEIAPQCMGDTILAELICGDEVIDAKDGYSIRTYAQNKLNSSESSDEFKQLLTDLLYYGAAAQKYKNYKADEALVTDGVENLGTPSTLTPTDTDNDMTGGASSDEEREIKAAGVRFDFDNKLYIKFIAPSLDGIVVKVNGEIAEIKDLGAGVYQVFSKGILATEFGNAVSFELIYNGEAIQSMTYSVDSYALTKWNNSQDPANAELALAMYRYGKSAVSYVN